MTCSRMQNIAAFCCTSLMIMTHSFAEDFRPRAQEQIVPADAKLELLWGEGEFAEGPAADPDGRIVFSDIGNRLLRFDPKTGKTEVFRDPSGRANGLMFDDSGRLVACEGANTGGNRRISITEKDGTVRSLVDDFEGKKFNSPNDLYVDSKRDRVYFTDPRYVGNEPRELDFEAVFVVQLSSGDIKVATRDVQKPNGILVSHDGKQVIVADNNGDPTGNHQLVSFEVQDDGTLENKKVLFDFGANRRGIDGMTQDKDGHIYATAGTGKEAGVYVFDARGTPLAFIATPGDPTNCEFGRGKEANTLYITAGNPKGPGEFGLYRIRLHGR